MPSPIKVVSIASNAQGISRKILIIRIVSVVVLVYLGFLLVGSGGSYVTGILSPLNNKLGSFCTDDSYQKLTSQTGNGDFTSADQKSNAQQIINEVARRNMPKRAAIIALATAMQESSLINVNYGDDIYGVTNPDGSLTTSKGLFQQQDFWGPLNVRMDPAGATGLFLDHLVKVDNWQALPITVAAQKVQGSAFPDAYAQWEARATEMADAMPPTSGSYGTATGSAPNSVSWVSDSTALCESGGKVGVGVVAGKGDDYPDDLKLALPDSKTDPWLFYNRECVSFVAWRMNVQMGWKPGQPAKFTNNMFPPELLGNAVTWMPVLKKAGYKVDNTPAPGAIAWWGANVNSGSIQTGEWGHVAVVANVNSDGTVGIEQYNAVPPHAYSTMTIPKDSPTNYIHVADLPK